MPLHTGGKEAVSYNIHELSHPNEKRRSHDQIVAIALHAAHEHKTHSVDDNDHKGSHGHDHIVLDNAHPHQQHSVGYHDTGSPRHHDHTNHGFDAVHITHHDRDKRQEHHPPHGLMEHSVETSERDGI